jgi:hypothetical protein
MSVICDRSVVFTDHHDITEILLEIALNTKPNPTHKKRRSSEELVGNLQWIGELIVVIINDTSL